ncbi:MAG TPA: 5-oxoprolinase subunit PxpA [Gemmatimonadaceae bacterium]|nr:5-oxoprolinase subunit PxpA [Gemmatimonadaceae bacterium]
MRTIDLNADLGEYTETSEAAHDSAILDLVSSANIACGVHAGNSEVMQRTVEEAMQRGVAIGAHPSFPDRDGFGRREMVLPAYELRSIVIAQIEALAETCNRVGAKMRYVKPHGALYNIAARDAAVALVIAEAVRLADGSLVLLGMAGTPLVAEANSVGLKTAGEAFADRAYLPSGRLAPRDNEWAVLHDAKEVSKRAVIMASEGAVYAVDGSRLPVKADSICIHGDNPQALELVRETRLALEAAGFTISPFAE